MDLECTVVTSISKILKMFLVKELYNYSFEKWMDNLIELYNKLSKLIQQPKETTRSILIASHVNKNERSEAGYLTKDQTTVVPYLTEEQKLELKDHFYEDTIKLKSVLRDPSALKRYKYI